MRFEHESLSKGGGSELRLEYSDIFPDRFCYKEECLIQQVQMSNDLLADNRVTAKILGITYHSSPYCGTSGEWAKATNQIIREYDKSSTDRDTSDAWKHIISRITRDDNLT